ncbi:MAG: alpha/beta fold hydrolase [Phycisphaerales bacterium]|nr:alpha/beta fold hydrolase [Phycisphaerales bacterium]
MPRSLLIFSLTAQSLAPGPASAEPPPAPPAIITPAMDLGTIFDRYQTIDRYGRVITYYVSAEGTKASGAEGGEEPTKLPLIVFIQGSGCSSAFSRNPEGKVGGGIQMLICRQANQGSARPRARVMVVEKPGVNFCDSPGQPGTAMDCSEEFLREQTLERWAGAVSAALESALALPGIDPSRVLVSGHSEGGIVAAAVAAQRAEVTAVGVLACGGPSQLFDMAELARRPRFDGEPEEDREARVEEVYNAWSRIAADPMSTTKFEWGHPHRRWSTFLSTSTLDELLKSRARVYIAYGTADQAVPVASTDVLRAELVRRGREVTCERIVGVDHGYAMAGKAGHEGLRGVIARMTEWFLE